MFYVALSTICILLVPLLAMYFTDEVNWNWFDFLVAGILLFGAGLAYILISKISKRLVYWIAVGIAILAGLFLIWVNLAVGIIGSGSNEANLLYLGVLLVGIFGAVYWRLHPKGMSNTMFITSIAQFMVPFIAMIFWKSSMEEPPGVIQIILINTIFALAFAVSGVLFRKADEK
jgi:hypothetical protein